MQIFTCYNLTYGALEKFKFSKVAENQNVLKHGVTILSSTWKSKESVIPSKKNLQFLSFLFDELCNGIFRVTQLLSLKTYNVKYEYM